MIPLSDLVYVEVQGHSLKFHLLNEQVIQCRGSLSSIKEELGKEFELCNAYYLIHLSLIQGIKKEKVITPLGEFPISRTKRKNFLDAFSYYMEGIEK